MPWTLAGVAESLLAEVKDHRRAVGARLRELRKARGMSQEDAAHAVGVAVKTWSNWERGRTNPYDTNWRKIGKAFDVDPGEIQGQPPAPLALHNSERLDQIDEKLDEILRRLNGGG